MAGASVVDSTSGEPARASGAAAATAHRIGSVAGRAAGWRSGWPVWAVLRMVGLAIIVGWMAGWTRGWTAYPRIDSDVRYYATWSQQFHHGALAYRDFNVEYPPGVLPLMLLPSGARAFELCYLALAFGADALIFGLVGRSEGGDHRIRLGSILWLVAPILIGPILWLRLDIFMAVALVGALVALRRERWRLAGACLAAATLIKLWPLVIVALVWPLLPRAAFRRMAAWAAGITAVPVLAVVLAGGGPGLGWMLHYQSGRGLEVESILALPILIAGDCGLHLPWVAAFGGFEYPVSGVATWLLGLGIPAALLLVARAVWRDRARTLTPPAVALLAVVAVLLPSKVISAQYVVWPVVVAAVALAALERTPRQRAHLLLATCAVAATTQALFPFAFISELADGATGLLAAVLHVQALLVWGVVAVRFALPADGAAEPSVKPVESVGAVESVTAVGTPAPHRPGVPAHR